MSRVVLPVADLEPGRMRAVDVDGISMLVVRTPDGAFHGLFNRCAHFGAALVHGRLERILDANGTGEYVLTDEYLVRCPWHGWEFSVATGRCLADPKRARVRVYDLQVEGENVVFERRPRSEHAG